MGLKSVLSAAVTVVVTTLAMSAQALGNVTLRSFTGSTASHAQVAAALSQNDCHAIAHFATGKSPSREIWVATYGSDTTGNGSATNPYATIRHAALRAAPGDAVRIRAGTYQGGSFISDLRGDTDKPIWIGGAPGEARPVIEGGGEGFHFVRARALVVHDLEVRNSRNNGINCDDGGDYANPEASRFIVFENLFIHDIGGTGNQDGLKISGINDFWVLGCEIARAGGSGSGSGVDMVGCHRGVIACSFFHELSANAVQAKGGTEDVEIRWCRMVECGHRAVNIGGSTGLQFFRPPLTRESPNAEARGIRVLANEIIGSQCAVAFVGCVNSVVAHNTIITPHNWILRILQETASTEGYEFLPCGNNRIESNLFYFDRSDLSTFVNIGSGTALETFVFSHNLWYAWDDPSRSRPSLPIKESAGVYNKDPVFSDPGAGDFSIPTESPAVGAGRNPSPVPHDMRGWCFADPPSIGAHEGKVSRRLDCNGDGRLNIHDVNCFRGEWQSRTNHGDYNGDTVIDLFDYLDFVASFNAGC